MTATTMDEGLRHLMDAPSVKAPFCAVCGRSWPLNEHHVVFRSEGELIGEDGKPRPKPTITLCGNGSVLYGVGPDGKRVVYCHGKAHHRMLHFDFRDGEWLVKETAEPVKRAKALGMPGWMGLDEFRQSKWDEMREALWERVSPDEFG